MKPNKGKRAVSWLAKLRPVEVRAIRRLRKQGWSQVRLAERFGVSQATISNLLRERIYRRVIDPEKPEPLSTLRIQKDVFDLTGYLDQRSVRAVEIVSDSLTGDHLLYGDRLLLEITSQARDGDIVVALVPGKTGTQSTIKRFYMQSETVVRLEPVNSKVEPLLLPLSAVQIEGQVLCVLRDYSSFQTRGQERRNKGA